MSTLKANIQQVKRNPALIQRLVVNAFESAHANDLVVPDAGNPFVFALEASAITASAGMVEDEALTRKQYASMATTPDEIYMHMSDLDYAGRFATPARTNFTVLLGIDEFKQKAVPVPGQNISKLVIPRNTVFRGGGYSFSLQYPIEIRLRAHGGIQVAYNVDRVSPLYRLESNLVENRTVTHQGVEFLQIDIPVHQFSISSVYAQLTPATPFKQTYPFDNQFYYCRVYTKNAGGVWEEIKTSHTEQVFDPYEPTAILRVGDGTLTVSMPEVYYTAGLVSGELRIDIHTTYGPLDLDLAYYHISDFTATWLDINQDPGDSVYIEPLNVFRTLLVMSSSVIAGGVNALTFPELRTRVVQGATNTSDIPITDAQLDNTMSDLGYELTKRIDNITSRVYRASRAMPLPDDGSVSSGIGSEMTTVEVNLDDLKTHNTVRYNDARITILPDTLYRYDNGKIAILTDTEIDDINAMSIEALTNYVNDTYIRYTPFHYVLDTVDHGIDVRAYYIENPTINNKLFVEENNTAGIEVAVGTHRIYRVEDGYKLQLQLRSGDYFKTLDQERTHVQLSYVPEQEIDRAYIEGVFQGYIDNEPVYEFHLTTNYDFDAANNIIFNAFKMYDPTTVRETATQLKTIFDVFIVIDNYFPDQYLPTAMDDKVGSFMLEQPALAIIQEQLDVTFGTALTNLWTNARGIVGSEIYETYPTDVLSVYESDVPDPDKPLITVEDGAVVYNYLHRAGDPVMVDGVQKIAHRAGEPKRTPDGELVVKHGRPMAYHVDLALFDGTYYFVTDTRAVAYRGTVPRSIVEWLTNDFTLINRKLLEQTELYFSPKTTIGNIAVIANDGQQLQLPSEQSFRVNYYLNNQNYRNIDLRNTLRQVAIDTIASVLTRATVSIDDMISEIKTQTVDDVISVSVTGLGGDLELNTLTVRDTATRCSIRKKLTMLPNEQLVVEDDVAISFILHRPEA